MVKIVTTKNENNNEDISGVENNAISLAKPHKQQWSIELPIIGDGIVSIALSLLIEKLCTVLNLLLRCDLIVDNILIGDQVYNTLLNPQYVKMNTDSRILLSRL